MDLVLCHDRACCLAAYEAGRIPLLVADGTRPSWIDDTQVVSPSAPSIPRTVPSLVCTFDEDDLTNAAARMLAESTNREYRRIRLSTEGISDALGNAASPRRICFVVPPLNRGDGISPPECLFRLISLMRDEWARCEQSYGEVGPEWGMLTAPDQISFTTSIARACLARSIALSFATGGVCLSPRTGAPWEDPLEPEAQVAWASGFSHSNVDVFPSRGWQGAGLEARVSAKRDWFLLEGHGRTYCLNEGMVCCGRSLDERLDTEGDVCLGVFSCVTSQHLRIDPRRYRARVVVLDCCEPANPLGYAWELGYDSCAFRFLAGAASAVITTDLLVARSDHSIIDILLHAAFCGTLGETVSRLNILRREANPPMPYILLGDPETPTFAETPTWAVALEGAHCEVPPEARAIEIPHPPVARIPLLEASFASPDGQICQALRTSAVHTPRGLRIIAFGGANGRPRRIRISRKEESAGPTMMARGDGIVPKWRSDLQKSWDIFQIEAATAVAKPDAKDAVIHLAEASVRNLAEFKEKSSGRSWPQDLWDVSISLTKLHVNCPVCGRDGLLKHYRSGSTLRVWYECLRCRITEDRPWGARDCTMRLIAPDIAPSDRCEVKLLINANTEVGVGTACLFIDGAGHGLQLVPDFRVFVIQAGESYVGEFELCAKTAPAPAQIYYLRALVLIGAEVHWLSRPLAVPGLSLAKAVVLEV
jgi:hypothetical protein